MIPFFGVGITNDSQAFATLNAIGNSYLSRRNENINPIQVEAQVPYWMIKNSDGYGNPSTMVNFLQEYYNWLTNHYGYENTNVFDITKLFDINNSPSFLLEHFVKTFAHDISSIYNLPNSERPTDDRIRNTIVNIKKEIYEEKSTEAVFKRLLSSLFGINSNEITIKYPKTRLMRLNGGILPWMSNGMNESISQFIGSTGEYSNERYSLIGSYLNQGVIYDNNLWQEYSYIVESPVDESNVFYEETVKNTLHPSGFKPFFEKKELFSEVAPADTNASFDYEVPIVANYYPYQLISKETLPRCTGCTGLRAEPGWSYPTFVFPDWDQKIKNRKVNTFGNIQVVNEFSNLKSQPNQLSPNDAIGTTCAYACGLFGGVSFYGVCGGLPAQPYYGITMALVGSEIKFFNDSDEGFVSFEWDLGDNTATETDENIDFSIPSLVHTYQNEGFYHVTMVGSKINGFEAFWGVTLDVGNASRDILGCFNCPPPPSSGKLYTKKDDLTIIQRIQQVGNNPGTPPFTYTWYFQNGTVTTAPNESLQYIIFDQTGEKIIGLTIGNRFGNTILNINVNVLDTPVYGITWEGGPYIHRYSTVDFRPNVVDFKGHTENEINLEWLINSESQSTEKLFQYTFDISGTYDIGLSYSSSIYSSDLRGLTFVEIYVGEAPEAATFTRTPSGDVFIFTGITFEATS